MSSDVPKHTFSQLVTFTLPEESNTKIISSLVQRPVIEISRID